MKLTCTITQAYLLSKEEIAGVSEKIDLFLKCIDSSAFEASKLHDLGFELVSDDESMLMEAGEYAETLFENIKIQKSK